MNFTYATYLSFVIVFLTFSCNRGSKEVVNFYLNDKGKRISQDYVKEKYFVYGKQKIKHGTYHKFSTSMLLIESGQYLNGEKTGIWKRFVEDDKIWIEIDYNDDGKVTPIIPKQHFRYPMILAEKLPVIPSGEMNLHYEFSDDCNLISAEIVLSVHPMLDSIILKRYKEYTMIMNKYEMPIEECLANKDSILVFNFIGE